MDLVPVFRVEYPGTDMGIFAGTSPSPEHLAAFDEITDLCTPWGDEVWTTLDGEPIGYGYRGLTGRRHAPGIRGHMEFNNGPEKDHLRAAFPDMPNLQIWVREVGRISGGFAALAEHELVITTYLTIDETVRIGRSARCAQAVFDLSDSEKVSSVSLGEFAASLLG